MLRWIQRLIMVSVSLGLLPLAAIADERPEQERRERIEQQRRIEQELQRAYRAERQARAQNEDRARERQQREQQERDQLQQRLESLHIAHEMLREAEQHDLAEQTAAHIRRLEEELHHHRPDQHHPDQVAQMMEQLLVLTEEVRGLRREVAELREQLEHRRAAEEEERLSKVDLSGEWHLALPSGHEAEATWEPRGDNLLQLTTKGVFRGLYRRDGRRLIVEIPSDERLTEFVWKVRDERTIVLVESPPVAKIGSDYRGAVLTRENRDRQTSEDASSTARTR